MSTQIKRVANITDREIDAEFENFAKQMVHKEDAVLKDTSGDPFIIKNFTDLYEIDKSTATLDNVVDMLGTLLKKLKEIQVIHK